MIERVSGALGILGVVRFTEGYYLIVSLYSFINFYEKCGNRHNLSRNDKTMVDEFYRHFFGFNFAENEKLDIRAELRILQFQVITKASVVATIGYHCIHKISEVAMITLAMNGVSTSNEEQKYVKIFQVRTFRTFLF